MKKFSNLYPFIKKMTSEPNGTPSSIRISVLFSTIVLVPTVTFISIYTTIQNPQYSGEMVLGILGSLCGMYGVKAYQRKNEPDVENGNGAEILRTGSSGTDVGTGSIPVAKTGDEKSLSD